MNHKRGLAAISKQQKVQGSIEDVIFVHTARISGRVLSKRFIWIEWISKKNPGRIRRLPIIGIEDMGGVECLGHVSIHVGWNHLDLFQALTHSVGPNYVGAQIDRLCFGRGQNGLLRTSLFWLLSSTFLAITYINQIFANISWWTCADNMPYVYGQLHIDNKWFVVPQHFTKVWPRFVYQRYMINTSSKSQNNIATDIFDFCWRFNILGNGIIYKEKSEAAIQWKL